LAANRLIVRVLAMIGLAFVLAECSVVFGIVLRPRQERELVAENRHNSPCEFDRFFLKKHVAGRPEMARRRRRASYFIARINNECNYFFYSLILRP
jgi:hypothetical protein